MTTNVRTSKVRRWMVEQDTVRLVCRVQGHWWPSSLGTLTAEKQGVYQLRQSCERGCGVDRNIYVNKNDGTVQASAVYHYPDGYKFSTGSESTGMDRATRGKVRLEVLRRAGE